MAEPLPLELSRPVPTSRIGAADVMVTVEASAAECAAIAKRLMVASVDMLQCTWCLRAGTAGSVEAEGSLQARLHQQCVVTLDTFPAGIVEEFAVRFVPAGSEREAADDPDEPDEVPFIGAVLELGEATVEQLALALDPYPRKPGAVLDPFADDGADNPFDALAKRRRDD